MKVSTFTMIVTALSVTAIMPVHAFDDPALAPITVYVKSEIVPEGVKYSYRVQNNSAKDINGSVAGNIASIAIGYDADRVLYELNEEPKGYDYFKNSTPATSYTAPKNWRFKVTRQDENPNLTVEWEVASEPSFSHALANYAIKPGQSLGGFSVILPKADDAYANGHWTSAPLGPDAMPTTTTYSAPLIPESACPAPRLFVMLNPEMIWPPSQRLETINAQITVQDDIDPNPVIKLESITTNEPINPALDIGSADFGTDDRSFRVRSERHMPKKQASGQKKTSRIYTVTYSATNSCGSSDIATATVIVPHDQSLKPKK